MDSIELFFHTETTEKYPSFADSLRLPVHRSCSGIIEAGLWECNIGWSPVVPAMPVAVGDECSSTICVQCESIWPDHASSSPAALASCTTANIFQAGSTGILVSEGSVPDVSEWQPAPCRRSSRSTTFAFCVISGSCCAADMSSVGDRAFCVTAAKTWNRLPSEMTSSVTLSTFKQKLKTYLFSLSFPGM